MGGMVRKGMLLATAFFASALARDRVAIIDFFGYKGIDIEAVRKALPVHAGDAIQKDLKKQIELVVKQITGRKTTDVAIICCVNQGDSVIFIGLPGASSRTFALNPPPGGSARPSPELLRVYENMERAEEAALHKGMSGEDVSRGYRLLKEPGARAADLVLRQYALNHEDELLALAESSRAHDRAIAIDTLGFGARTRRQMAALVRASRDPDSLVRNEATRAIGEILEGDDKASSEVPVDMYIEMVSSGVWTDRNKASVVLDALTESRDPAVLAKLKAEASEALLEMARWQVGGWASVPRVILGRIAGVPEDRAIQLSNGPLDAFLAAIKAAEK